MHKIEEILRHHLIRENVNRKDIIDLEPYISIAANAVRRHYIDLYERKLIDFYKESLLQIEYQHTSRLSSIEGQLFAIREILDTQREDGPVCRFREEGPFKDISQLILRGSSKPLDEYSGKREADKTLIEWLFGATEVICIDPYLFKRSHDLGETPEQSLANDTAYADQLLEVVGGNRQVTFIYQSNSSTKTAGATRVSKNVANRIEAKLSDYNIAATFCAVEDLHDRVWLKRHIDHKGNVWQGKVVGTSRDGIGRRPTYLIDMPTEDCDEYMKYVKYLLSIAKKDHQRPVNNKPKSSKTSP